MVKKICLKCRQDPPDKIEEVEIKCNKRRGNE